MTARPTAVHDMILSQRFDGPDADERSAAYEAVLWRQGYGTRRTIAARCNGTSKVFRVYRTADRRKP